MWPFRRQSPSVDGPSATPGWKDVPALQRTMPAISTTVGTSAFTSDLAAWRRPEAMVRPLEHAVTADAPSGIISGLARPAVQRKTRERIEPPAPQSTVVQRWQSLAPTAWTSDSDEPQDAPAVVSTVAAPSLTVAPEQP